MYKRTPDAFKQQQQQQQQQGGGEAAAVVTAAAELQAAFALLQRLWVRDYPHVWTALQVGGSVGWGRQANTVKCSRDLRQSSASSCACPLPRHTPRPAVWLEPTGAAPGGGHR